MKKMELVAFFCGTLALAVDATMMTPWGEGVTSENCWRDYPRPQMVRSEWTNLNGNWDYAVTSVTNTSGRPTTWQGKIRVPYAIESSLSGVGRELEPDQFLWYTRKIVCAKRPGERILLHFGAVDFRTMVFIGHQEVTDVPHEGGQNPFTLDITDFAVDGENELTVCVWDPTEEFVNSRGKQSFDPHVCFYTRVSGIWQTVWMENVPENHIRGYKVVTDIDRKIVRLDFDIVGEGVVIVKVDGLSSEHQSVRPSDHVVEMAIPDAKLWSPEEPNLYSFTAKCGKDEIRGYFGTHPDTIGGDAIPADWPGFVRRFTEKALEGVKCIFFNGALGDVNHVCVDPKPGEREGLKRDFDDVDRGYEHAKHMGRVIAEAVMSIYGKCAPVEAGEVSFSVKDVSIPSNRPKPEDLPLAHKYSELHAAGKDGEIPFKGMELTTVVAEAGRMLRLENGPNAFAMPISTVRIGNALAFVGIPGEPFTEIGRRIKAESSAAMTVVSCITNGYYGYFPTANAYQEGGYEARASIFGPTVAEDLICAARG